MGLGGRMCLGAYIVWPEGGSYYHALLSGVEEACEEQGINLLVFATNETDPDESKGRRAGNLVYDYLESDILDGLIVIEKQLFIHGNSDLEIKKPLVSINQPLRDFPAIMADSTPGFDALLDHLFRLHGYCDPVFVSGPLVKSDAVDRLRCFKEALKRFGIRDSEDRIFYGNFIRQDGGRAVKHFYDALSLHPDVVVCANDGMAIGAYQELQSRGIFVPNDVALTGFDDTPLFVWYEGMLTSVRQPIRSAGRLAVSMLQSMIAGTAEAPELTRLPTEFVVRKSCGCTRSAKDWLSTAELPPDSEASWVNVVEKNDSEQIAEFLLQNEALENVAKLDRDQSIDSRLARYCDEYMKDWRISGHSQLEKNILLDLEIGTQYLSLFEFGKPGLSGTSRLAVAWIDGTRAQLPEGGIPFPTCDFIPREFLPDHRVTLIVEPLVNGEDAYGLLMLHYGARGTNIYEKYRYRLSEAIKSVITGTHLKKLNEELEAARAQFEELSLADELTGQHNRRGFVTLAAQQISYCRRQGEPFSILFIDLDGLKGINDTWGHEEGDLAIQSISSVIKKAFRATDITARLGGDEFIVLASNTSPSTVVMIIERLTRILEETNRALAKPWTLSISSGQFYSDPGCTMPLEEMMRLADEQLYLEKRHKKAAKMSRTGPN